MILPKDKLLTRLISCLRPDLNDSRHLHVEIDVIITYLHDFGLNVPPIQYESLVNKFMKQQVLNKIDISRPHTRAAVAEGLIELAFNLLTAAEKSMYKSVNTEPKMVD